MANQEQLDLLNQGTEVWNTWRKQHPSLRPDLSGADLSGAVLIKANLSHAILFNADLSHAILEGTNFNKAWVTKEQLAQAKSLKGATMPDGSIHP